MKKKFKFVAIGLGLIAVVAFGMWQYATTYFSGMTWVYLPEGTTREAMADSLRHSLGDSFGGRVATLYGLLAADSVAPRGAYRVTSGDRAIDVANRIAKRRQTPVDLTFNNIRTFPQLAERIASGMDFTAADFTAAADSLLPAAGFRPEEYVAAFLPDTYEFYWTTPAADVISRLLAHRNSFWNDERRARAASLGLTPVKVATICSIAEEETNDPEERGTVGRLYLNRVRRGMKLQADPTVKFAVCDFSLRRILSKHLQTPSPYNTYRVSGLPPGPIRMPERRTMETFLSAPDNDYLYMCAKEDFSGRHNFASDYATHQANARRYRRALDESGIK